MKTPLDLDNYSASMTVRAERARKFSKKELSACGARPKLSFLDENITLRRTLGPMTFVKFVICNGSSGLSQGQWTFDRASWRILNAGPKAPKIQNPVKKFELKSNNLFCEFLWSEAEASC